MRGFRCSRGNSSARCRSAAPSALNASRAAAACPPCARIASLDRRRAPIVEEMHAIRYAPQRHRAKFAACRGALQDSVGEPRTHVVQQQIRERMNRRGVGPRVAGSEHVRLMAACRSRPNETRRRRATIRHAAAGAGGSIVSRNATSEVSGTASASGSRRRAARRGRDPWAQADWSCRARRGTPRP